MMKSFSFADRGAGRYVVGPVAPFDQKNEMFKRPWWDPSMADLGEKFYHAPVMPRDQAGYRLKDFSLVNAAWRVENEMAQGVRGGRMGLYDWTWEGKFNFPRVPAGLKISDVEACHITGAVKRAAILFGASLAGTCKLDRRWLYKPAYMITPDGGKVTDNPIPDEFQYAVVIAVEMDYRSIQTSPSAPASAATGMGYSKMAFVSGLLAQYIRGLGYRAIPCGNDTACSIPMAIDAGLGEIARNGLLVTPEFGPRVRLAKVLTDLPLRPDRPITFGVWNFCMICKKCAKKCPSRSIMHGDPTEATHNISNREGVRAWHINAETCLAFWAKNGTDCANCIRVCPFNKPSGRVHDLVRWGIYHAPRLNPLFLWGDDQMGYGKRKI
ncbi:MAG: reductive dehalogenase [Deltaproteobacteria bacterium]|nr:MAG: reductive dehalogenase [Deltaproteobacteria bacterium]